MANLRRDGKPSGARRHLRLAEVATAVAVPSPIELQRRGAGLLAVAAEQARKQGWAPLATAGGPLDVLDALTYDLVVALGRALGAAEVCRGLAPVPVTLEVPVAHPDLHATARRARRLGIADVELTPDGPSRRQARRLAVHAAGASARALRSAPAMTPAPPAATDVVIVGQQPGHLADAAPLLDGFAADGTRTVYLVPDQRVAASARAADRPWLLATSGRRALFGELGRFATHSARLVALLRRSQAVRAACTDALEHQVLVATTARVLAGHGPSLVALAGPTGALLDQGPELVVAVNPYDHTGRTVLALARARGIPTAAVEHGTIYPDDPKWRTAPVDLVCTWGQASARALQRSGYGPERIAVTGAPRFDAAVASAGTVPPELAERAPWVLVATSGAGIHVSLEQHLAFIEILHEAAARAPEVRWLVRLHPKDDPTLYAQAARRHPSGDVVVVEPGHSGSRTGIYEHLAGASALVTVTSTSALDAMRTGTPVVLVPPTGQDSDDLPEMLGDAAVRTCTTAEELAAAVRWPGEPALSGCGSDSGPRVDDQRLAEHMAHQGAAAAETLSALTDLRLRRRAAAPGPP